MASLLRKARKPPIQFGMVIRKAHVYRLSLTAEQETTLGRWVGAVRFVYNLALEQRRDWWRPGRKFNAVSQCLELTALRKEAEWIREVPAQSMQQALRDLERSYQNWWEGRSGMPLPRKRGVNDTIRFPAQIPFQFRRLSGRWGEVKIPKIGWLRIRWDKGVPGEVKNITIARRSGVWTAAAQYEYEINDPEPSTLPVVGIDRGIAVFAALSDGTMIASENFGKKATKALTRAQRKLSRKKKGSNNRKKQIRRVARMHARIAAARKDFAHKASAAIAKNHGVVVLEKLEVQNMVRSAKGTVDAPGVHVRQKSGLNRSILDQGWGYFRTFLSYKLAERGGLLVEVDPRNTSRTCSACGVVDRASRNGQRFRCVACGHEAHADTNAAIEILRRWGSPSLPVEGGRKAPCEAGTSRKAA